MNFQGNHYSYANLTFSFLGNEDVKGVKSISFSAKQEKPNVYGAGPDPIGYTEGNIEYEGQMELTQKTIIAMRNSGNYTTLLQLPPFDLVAALANGTDPITTWTLGYIRIEEDGLTGASGDTELVYTLPFKFSTIKRS